jgi:crotonobetainyl-CoA:carnitine CoA-transferase CaiB-like acyl-CoA transferase
MLQHAVTGQPPAPMPARISAWALYDVFTVADQGQIFLAAVSDTQWAALCAEFGWPELATDPRLQGNNARVLARDWLLPLLRERFAAFTVDELARRFEARGLPYAPITRPEALFDDPHLQATGGLATTTLPADASAAGRPVATRVPLLPLTLDGQRLPLRHDPPSVGQHNDELLRELGYPDAEVAALRAAGVLR